MAWYRTGTVAVTLNSTTVTGTGTNFAQNARVGDAFQGPDGKWYEITNIASATVLSILPAYTSASATGGVYALAPMQGYVKESADQLRAITNQFGTTLSLLGTPTDTAGLRTNIGAAKSGVNGDITSITGLTTALPINQGGTGSNNAAGARSNLGLGTSATLDATTTQTTTAPISFNTGHVTRVGEAVYASRYTFGTYSNVSTVVNIDNVPGGDAGLYTTANTNGGTYPTGFANVWIETQQTYTGSSRVQHAYSYAGSGTTPNFTNPKSWLRVSNQPGTAWGRWCEIYNQSNVVGTVAGTSTVPTGSVIERGSNVNGEYTKFADGTMWCWHRQSGLSTASTALGSLFVGETVPFTFPATFSAAPVVIPSASRAGGGVSVWAQERVSPSTTATSLSMLSAVTGATGYICYIAIGRWAA
jgi:hypothetical protein